MLWFNAKAKCYSWWMFLLACDWSHVYLPAPLLSVLRTSTSAYVFVQLVFHTWSLCVFRTQQLGGLKFNCAKEKKLSPRKLSRTRWIPTKHRKVVNDGSLQRPASWLRLPARLIAASWGRITGAADSPSDELRWLKPPTWNSRIT